MRGSHKQYQARFHPLPYALYYSSLLLPQCCKLSPIMKTLACLFCCLVALSAQAQFLATTNSATLVWNAVVDPDLSGYQLFYWTGVSTNVHSVPATQLTDRIVNLNWSATYTCAVKSVAQRGTNTLVSAFSAPVMLVTPLAPPPPLLPPSAPQGLSILGP